MHIIGTVFTGVRLINQWLLRLLLGCLVGLAASLRDLNKRTRVTQRYVFWTSTHLLIRGVNNMR